MAKSNVIWAEFAGHGFVAGPFSSSVISGVTLVSGDVYTVTFLWTNIYTDANILIDNVGARMYVEGYSNRTFLTDTIQLQILLRRLLLSPVRSPVPLVLEPQLALQRC